MIGQVIRLKIQKDKVLEFEELVGTKCIYGINFFKSTSFTNTKCKVSDIGFERLQLIKQ